MSENYVRSGPHTIKAVDAVLGEMRNVDTLSISFWYSLLFLSNATLEFLQDVIFHIPQFSIPFFVNSSLFDDN